MHHLKSTHVLKGSSVKTLLCKEKKTFTSKIRGIVAINKTLSWFKHMSDKNMVLDESKLENDLGTNRCK